MTGATPQGPKGWSYLYTWGGPCAIEPETSTRQALAFVRGPGTLCPMARTRAAQTAPKSTEDPTPPAPAEIPDLTTLTRGQLADLQAAVSAEIDTRPIDTGEEFL